METTCSPASPPKAGLLVLESREVGSALAQASQVDGQRATGPGKASGRSAILEEED